LADAKVPNPYPPLGMLIATAFAQLSLTGGAACRLIKAHASAMQKTRRRRTFILNYLEKRNQKFKALKKIIFTFRRKSSFF
jgi:hypothetical protein